MRNGEQDSSPKTPRSECIVADGTACRAVPSSTCGIVIQHVSGALCPDAAPAIGIDEAALEDRAGPGGFAGCTRVQHAGTASLSRCMVGVLRRIDAGGVGDVTETARDRLVGADYRRRRCRCWRNGCRRDGCWLDSRRCGCRGRWCCRRCRRLCCRCGWRGRRSGRRLFATRRQQAHADQRRQGQR